jgi:hypothetical protein
VRASFERRAMPVLLVHHEVQHRRAWRKQLEAIA